MIRSNQVDEEALGTMDADAVNHWKRYVGADTAMERGNRAWI